MVLITHQYELRLSNGEVLGSDDVTRQRITAESFRNPDDHGWEVWTEGGIGSGTILNQIVDAVEQLDPIPVAQLFAAVEAQPPGRSLTGKYRLQMSIPPASSGITDWAGDWNVPTMVVNRKRY